MVVQVLSVLFTMVCTIVRLKNIVSHPSINKDKSRQDVWKMECFKINTSKANVHSQSLKQHAGLCTRYSAYILELLAFCFYVTPEWINGWSLILVTSLGLFFFSWFVLSNTQVRTLLFYIIILYFDIDIF